MIKITDEMVKYVIALYETQEDLQILLNSDLQLQ